MKRVVAALAVLCCSGFSAADAQACGLFGCGLFGCGHNACRVPVTTFYAPAPCCAAPAPCCAPQTCCQPITCCQPVCQPQCCAAPAPCCGQPTVSYFAPSYAAPVSTFYAPAAPVSYYAPAPVAPVGCSSCGYRGW